MAELNGRTARGDSGSEMQALREENVCGNRDERFPSRRKTKMMFNKNSDYLFFNRVTVMLEILKKSYPLLKPALIVAFP